MYDGTVNVSGDKLPDIMKVSREKKLLFPCEKCSINKHGTFDRIK